MHQPYRNQHNHRALKSPGKSFAEYTSNPTYLKAGNLTARAISVLAAPLSRTTRDKTTFGLCFYSRKNPRDRTTTNLSILPLSQPQPKPSKQPELCVTACRDHPCTQELLTLGYLGKNSDVSSKRLQISAATRIWPCLSLHLPVRDPGHRATMDWKHSRGENRSLCRTSMPSEWQSTHYLGYMQGFLQEEENAV